MAEAFAPTSDHARTLAEAAGTKAASAKFAKALSDGKSDMFKLNPFLIRVEEGFNSRDFSLAENAEHVEDLARSIAAEGVRKPIEVRFGEDGQPYLVDGECRLRATIKAINDLGAEIVTVPAVVSPKGQNDADRVASQFVSNSGKPFSELEAAQGVRRLLGFGWDEAKIATRTGMRAAKVARLIRVLEMPEAIVGMVREGQVAVTQALDTVRSADTSDAAVAVLRDGLARASETGRTKVTARHVAKPAGASPQAALSALRQAFATADREAGTDGVVTYHVNETAAAVIRQHLGV